jgi:hypothetical protein
MYEGEKEMNETSLEKAIEVLDIFKKYGKCKRLAISAIIVMLVHSVAGLALLVINPPEYWLINGVLEIFDGITISILGVCMCKTYFSLPLEEKHFPTILFTTYSIFVVAKGASDILGYATPTLTVLIGVLDVLWIVSFAVGLFAFIKSRAYHEIQIDKQKLLSRLNETLSEARAEAQNEAQGQERK